MAKVGQLQLAQPPVTVGWSVLLLGERATPLSLLVAVGVLVAVASAQRAPVLERDQGAAALAAPQTTPGLALFEAVRRLVTR